MKISESVAAGPVLVTDLALLEQKWKALWKACGRPSPFLSWEWHQSWVEEFQDRIQPRVLAESFSDGELAGLLPLQQVRRRGLGQWEMLSSGSGADELDCLIHPRASASVCSRLLRLALAGKWQLCRMETLNPGGNLATRMARGMIPASIRVEPGEPLPYLPLPDSFEQLLLQHSANFRAEIRRRRRNLERRGGTLRFQCAEHPEEIEDAMNVLFQLHNLRRRQKQDAGIFEDHRLRSFHSRAARRLALAGMTRVYLLHAAGQPVAALYGFETNASFYYFQSGLDPDCSHLSPGTVLMSFVVEDCIRRGLRQFEFLRGGEAYKSRWTSSSRSTINVLMGHGSRGRIYLRLRDAWLRHKGEIKPDPGLATAEECDSSAPSIQIQASPAWSGSVASGTPPEPETQVPPSLRSRQPDAVPCPSPMRNILLQEEFRRGPRRIA